VRTGPEREEEEAGRGKEARRGEKRGKGDLGAHEGGKELGQEGLERRHLFVLLWNTLFFYETLIGT